MQGVALPINVRKDYACSIRRGTGLETLSFRGDMKRRTTTRKTSRHNAREKCLGAGSVLQEEVGGHRPPGGSGRVPQTQADGGVEGPGQGLGPRASPGKPRVGVGNMVISRIGLGLLSPCSDL